MANDSTLVDARRSTTCVGHTRNECCRLSSLYPLPGTPKHGTSLDNPSSKTLCVGPGRPRGEGGMGTERKNDVSGKTMSLKRSLATREPYERCIIWTVLCFVSLLQSKLGVLTMANGLLCRYQNTNKITAGHSFRIYQFVKAEE